MPRDVSSSSSEDEADNPIAESSAKPEETGKKTTRYQCPADFTALCHKPCSSTLAKSLKNNNGELWLIKAPASFNPQSISGMKMNLSGLQTLKVPSTGSVQQIYSFLPSTHGSSELRLLTSKKKSSGAMIFGPAFSGQLNVCEVFGGSTASQTPQVIPAAPAPCIPPGLKQRFHPFGSKTPTLTYVAESKAEVAAFGPSSTTLCPLVVKQFTDVCRREDVEERTRKKKKKKEKRIKTEGEEDEVVSVKEEPVTEIQEEEMMEPPFQEEEVSEERRRKKKRKKKDRVEEGEPTVTVKEEEVTVKSEPKDTSYSDAVESSGRKKKKKRSRTEVD